MILEYFSLGKGPFTGTWGRLEKFLPFDFRIITSYMKMSGMPCFSPIPPSFLYIFFTFIIGKKSFFLTWLCMKYLPLDIQQQSINQSNYKEEDHIIWFHPAIFLCVTNQELDLQLIFLISMI